MSDELARIAIALVAVLGMIGGGAMLAKRLGLASQGVAIGAKRRLAIVESMALDARRRVAIIRCDNAEHLILLGANGESVIASDIGGGDAGGIVISNDANAESSDDAPTGGRRAA